MKLNFYTKQGFAKIQTVPTILNKLNNILYISFKREADFIKASKLYIYALMKISKTSWG